MPSIDGMLLRPHCNGDLARRWSLIAWKVGASTPWLIVLLIGVDRNPDRAAAHCDVRQRSDAGQDFEDLFLPDESLETVGQEASTENGQLAMARRDAAMGPLLEAHP